MVLVVGKLSPELKIQTHTRTLARLLDFFFRQSYFRCFATQFMRICDLANRR